MHILHLAENLRTVGVQEKAASWKEKEERERERGQF